MAAFVFGLITLAWHDYNGRDLVRVVGSASGGLAFVYAVAAAQIFGGVAIQFRPSAKAGAVVLGSVYLVFALLWVPRIVATPQIYDFWGNFFEQFSLVLGAAFVYASMSPEWKPKTVNRLGAILLGVCAASFAVEQAIHLKPTAGLVPKWLPPSQMFWAEATTIAFALAAVALFANRAALLGTRLLTAMIVSFGLLVWVPLLFSNPHSDGNWGEGAETFAIAGAAWLFADVLGKNRRHEISSTRLPAA